MKNTTTRLPFNLQVRLDHSTYEKLKAVCEKQHINRLADLARMILKKHLENYDENGNRLENKDKN